MSTFVELAILHGALGRRNLQRAPRSHKKKGLTQKPRSESLVRVDANDLPQHRAAAV